MRTLQGALLSGHVGHAYLFCGPRGTGKTTMARLFAKAVNCASPSRNCTGIEHEVPKSRPDNIGGESSSTPGNIRHRGVEPCNLCDSCVAINESRSLDLIEIDAASNGRVDEVRELRDSARVSAPSGGYKVFIIDEVHMMTTSAFNALLKTLEEPPSHVIFVLATTEPHKVLETIMSRVQRFDFKKIPNDQIVKKLKRVAGEEKIKIDEPALAAIASAASGSLRDAESSFAKLIAYSGANITSGDVAEVLGIVSFEVHKRMFELIADKNRQEALNQINELCESGVDLENFTKQFIRYLRTELVDHINKRPQAANNYPQATLGIANGDNQASPAQSPEFLIKVITAFVKVGGDLKFSPIPQLPLELAVLELTG